MFPIRALVCIILAFFNLSLVTAKRCVYHHVLRNDTFVSCDTGCCYSYIYPCCEEQFFDTDAFKISISFAAVGFLITLVLLLLRWNLRNSARNRMARASSNRPDPITSNVGVPIGSVSATNYGYNNYYNASSLPSAYPSNSAATGTDNNFNNNFMSGPPAYSSVQPPPPAYEDLNNGAFKKTNNQ